MKPLVVLLTVVILAAGLAVGAQVPRSAPFPDVPRDHWAYRAVESLRQKGILLGYPGATKSGIEGVAEVGPVRPVILCKL